MFQRRWKYKWKVSLWNLVWFVVNFIICNNIFHLVVACCIQLWVMTISSFNAFHKNPWNYEGCKPCIAFIFLTWVRLLHKSWKCFIIIVRLAKTYYSKYWKCLASLTFNFVNCYCWASKIYILDLCHLPRLTIWKLLIMPHLEFWI